MRSLALASLALAALLGRAPAQPGTLQSLLDAELAAFPAVTGVYVKHLTTGAEAGVRAEQDFSTASVIKLTFMIDPAFASLTAEETSGLMYASDRNPLFDRYADLFAGARVKWIDAVRDPVNRQRLARERDERTSTDRKFWLGSMTPRDTARLLESIERGTAASRESCGEMLLALRRQQLGARRLPHFVDVAVGHKTGDGGSIANDVGVIYARSGPIVVASFANGVKGSYAEAEDRIGQLGRMLVDYFDRGR